MESISINEYLYPVAQRGRFESSDPLLNSLWQACADTAYLNFEDTLVHEGYRERAIFNTGDGSHVMHMAFAGFGALPLTDRFLRLVPFSGRGDGMLQMVYPPENPQRYVVSSFLLQWSSRVREHYLFTGREPVLRELYRSVPPPDRLVRAASRHDGAAARPALAKHNRLDSQRPARRQLHLQRLIREGAGGRRLAGRSRRGPRRRRALAPHRK